MATSPSSPSLLGTLRILLTTLSPDELPYCIIGGLAVGAWGRPRATKDIDLLIMLDEVSSPELLSMLESAGFVVDHEWAYHNPMMNGRGIRLRYGSYPLDLMIPKDAQEREALTRRILLNLQEAEIAAWMCSPEDLIILKLKAYRDLDLVDAQSVVHQFGNRLDLNYLWKWADHFALQSELHYVLGAGQPPA